MITKRTKLLLWLGMFPLVVAAGGAALLGISYLYLYLHNGQATYFLTLHFRVLPTVAVTILLFVCALISHFVDRKHSGTK